LKNKLKTVFIGTAPFGFPLMRTLAEHSQVVVKSVITRPDRRSGRGQKVTTPPVGEFARELGLPLFQPEKKQNLKENFFIIMHKDDL